MARQKKSDAKTGKTARNAGGATPAAGYAVLARKYRPATFDDLIGQDAMVRTLTNAFASGRIAQAYMLTGVRGVGKTTTARILARAFNYEAPGVDGPTIGMKEMGEHCAAIMESRHVDVLEMDAASHTGIDDVREIIESARYKPVSARSKVYIVDEVHMLSKAAFNGLLKTLEEPPGHVKFIFATTEIRKVPVTVLSRCQRFDLRRVGVELLQKHFAKIAKLENIDVGEDALALIARAAEGSVRDGLSILDQAIAHAGGAVTGEHVRAMLGLADRGRVFDLLETVLKGDARGALRSLRSLYDDGAEPERILADMAAAVHVVTRIAAAGAEAADPTLSESELERAAALAEKLDMPALARAWQMLLKGGSEVQAAPRPLVAAEMVLVRMCYLSGQPSPEDLARQVGGREMQESHAGEEPALPLQGGNGGAVARAVTGSAAPARAAGPAPEARPGAEGVRLPASFEEVVALVEAHREVLLVSALKKGVRLVSFSPPSIEIGLVSGSYSSVANDLREFLTRETGRTWVVAISEREGEKTIAETEEELAAEQEVRRRAEIEQLKSHPAVREVMEHFPGAEIADVRPLSGADENDGGEAGGKTG